MARDTSDDAFIRSFLAFLLSLNFVLAVATFPMDFREDFVTDSMTEDTSERAEEQAAMAVSISLASLSAESDKFNF